MINPAFSIFGSHICVLTIMIWAMSHPNFIHLRLHTEYSLLEGAMRLKKLPGAVADMGMPAVAVTDTNNMFCALEFSEATVKAGVQPIIGCQIDVEFDPAQPGAKPRPPAPVVLLAQSEQGYENLMALNSCQLMLLIPYR